MVQYSQVNKKIEPNGDLKKNNERKVFVVFGIVFFFQVFLL